MDNSAETVVDINGVKAATQLPEPSGASILCAVPDIDAQFGNGIIKSEETKRNEEILCVVYFVVALGPDCYLEKEKFPSGPYCKKGDFVLVAAHTGVQVSIHGKAFRIIYDDQVRSVVQDPRGIQR
jgi:co-chaperonin GroES (HSP10)